MSNRFLIAEFDHTPQQDQHGTYYKVRVSSGSTGDRGYWTKYRPDVERLEVGHAQYLAMACIKRLEEAS